MKKILKKILIFASIITILLPNIAYAGDIDYSTNGIEFLGDDECLTIDSSSNTQSQASSDNEKIVAEFLASSEFEGASDKHLNAVQIAALLGNFEAESGFDPDAANGESFHGIAQWSNTRYPNIKEPRNDIKNQLDYIKKELDGGYKNNIEEFWDSSSSDDLEKATYSITRNYEVAYNSGKEKSSTVWTNEQDAIANVQSWPERIKAAKKAYNTYGNIAQSPLTTGSGCSGGELISGGMTLDQAQDFMETYKKLPSWGQGETGPYGINWTSCAESPLANCVAFSQYFVNRYTDKKLSHPGNGSHVVGSLLSLGFKDGGHTPKVYAVFSQEPTSSNEYGHTGVVLGIDTENDKMIIGEAACDYGMDAIKARSVNISDFSQNNYTYAYTSLTPDDAELSDEDSDNNKDSKKDEK